MKILFDDIAASCFADEAQFREALNLLATWVSFKSLSADWEAEVEPFLSELDEYRTRLLDNAIRYRSLYSELSTTQVPAYTNCEPAANGSAAFDASERYTPLDSNKLSKLIDTYLDQKRNQWDIKKVDTNLRDIKPKLQLLVELVGDVESKTLAPNHIARYVDALYKLPKNANKGSYASLKTSELLSLDLPTEKRLSHTTRKNYAGKLATFLQWLGYNNYAKADLAHPLKSLNGKKIKRASEERPAFTEAELQRLFSSKEYTQKGHKQAAHYWVPLLALFTGARQRELCQLYVEDIYADRDSNVWVIDINDRKDKSLKEKTHARLVPIHKELKALGFIKYVESLDSERVFPDLTSDQRDGYSMGFSKWFCRTYLNSKNCNIQSDGYTPNAVFHSFRHNVITQLDHGNVKQNHIAHLVGHAPSDGSETTRRYAKDKTLTMKLKDINKLNYPFIELGKIKHWRVGFKPFTN